MSTDQTTKLGLPFLMPAQAQKHVTVNESLLRLDALVQAAVESRSVGVQPGSPADGAVWIMPAGKTGPEWGGYANGSLAYYRDGSWEAIPPRAGWLAWVKDEGVLVRYDGLAWTSDLAVASLSGGPLGGLRNQLINGDFCVWQRGASFASPAHGAFTADRWDVRYDGSGATRTISRETFAPGQTDVPGEPAHFLRFAQSVAGSGATQNLLDQKIEGVRTLAGQTATLSFYAKADAPRTLGARLSQQFGSGGSASVATGFTPSSVSLTTSWQKFTMKVAAPSISGKTIGGATNALWLALELPINTTFTVDVARIQLEEGPVATLFERRPVGFEELLCKRYYERIVGDDVMLAAGFVFSGTLAVISFPYTPKRAAPTFTQSGAFKVFDGGSFQVVTALVMARALLSEAQIHATVASGITAGRGAGLFTSTTSDYVAFDAEL